MKFTHFEKLVLLDFYNLPQPYIAQVAQKYPRMRDLTKQPSPLVPHVILSSLLATLLNTTIFSKSTFNSKFGNLTANYPVILPYIQLFDANPATPVYQLYHHHRKQLDQGSSELAKFVHLHTLGHNLCYCDVHKFSSYGEFSLLQIFKTSADSLVWICLLLSITLVSVLISARPRANLIITSPELIATLSVLLTNGSSGILHVKQSPLFILWMYMSVVMVTYYSSSMTSVLIRPPPDEKMTSLSDLKLKDYSLIFDSNGFEIKSLKSRVQRIMKPMEASEFKLNLKMPETLKTLNELLNKAILVDTFAQIETLATSTSMPHGKRYSMAASWPIVMFYATRAQALASELDAADGKRRICRVGKELFLETKYFYGFTPPGSAALQQKFTLLMALGIVKYWVNEAVAMTSAPRVQKRIQVKSPTQLFEPLPPPKPIEIEGKIQNVFALWGLCLGYCVVAFLLELVFSKIMMRHRKGFGTMECRKGPGSVEYIFLNFLH